MYNKIIMRVQFKELFFFICFIIAFFKIHAQPDLKFSTISIRDGLSSNSINDIINDEAGFLWVATDDGLNRFDGQEIKRFHHQDSILNSLSDNTTYCLFITNNHDFLIGTHSGLSRYNSVYETFETLVLPEVRVKHIIQSKINNQLYLSTDKGLYVYSDDYKLIHHFNEFNSNLPINSLKDVKED